MRRWKLALLSSALGLSGLLTGCKYQLFERETERDYYRLQALKQGAPENLDTNISTTVVPGDWSGWPVPPTVDNLAREPRPLSLQEAVAIALEQGTTGFLTLGGGVGQANETVQSGRSGTFSDAIRVLALDPAIAGADIEASLAKFDTRWISSATWGKRDDAPLNILNSFQNGDNFNLTTGMYKPLATGGVVGITSSLDYQKSVVTNPGTVFINPSYRPRVQLQFEQPLLQSYGVEINQLNVSHPGSIQIPNFRPPGGGRVEGILITRIRYEQARAEFERNVNHMLLNVETAYWNLWAAYGALYARDKVLADAYDVWRRIELRRAGGIQVLSEAKQAEAQLEGIRAQRYQALGQVIEAERQLRLLLGMADDGKRLVPIDTPTVAPFEPDWFAAVNEALTNRPELVQARQDLKTRQFDILIQRNLLKPDLRFFSNYDINGVGSRLDGSALDFNGNFHNALATLSSDKFNTWSFGLRLDVPIGYRDAHSALRVARLNLLRTYASLRDNERKVVFELRNQYSKLFEHLRTVEAQDAQYTAAKKQYDTLKDREQLAVGGEYLSVLTAELNAQQVQVSARTAEYQAIANYNNTLAAYQFAKGTIMQYDNVMIGEGPLPECAQIRATDHFREQSVALVKRERPAGEFGPTGLQPIERDPLADVMPVRVEPPPSVLDMQVRPPVAGPGPGGPLPAQPAAGPAPNPNIHRWPSTPANEVPPFRVPPPGGPVVPTGGMGLPQ